MHTCVSLFSLSQILQEHFFFFCHTRIKCNWTSTSNDASGVAISNMSRFLCTWMCTQHRVGDIWCGIGLKLTIIFLSIYRFFYWSIIHDCVLYFYILSIQNIQRTPIQIIAIPAGFHQTTLETTWKYLTAMKRKAERNGHNMPNERPEHKLCLLWLKTSSVDSVKPNNWGATCRLSNHTDELPELFQQKPGEFSQQSFRCVNATSVKQWAQMGSNKVACYIYCAPESKLRYYYYYILFLFIFSFK